MLISIFSSTIVLLLCDCFLTLTQTKLTSNSPSNSPLALTTVFKNTTNLFSIKDVNFEENYLHLSVDTPNIVSQTNNEFNDAKVTHHHWKQHLNNKDHNHLHQAKSNVLNRKSRLALLTQKPQLNITWPIKRIAEMQGDIILGGLMMVHEREDRQICGPIMPQGGIQALECMLHTIDWVNNQEDFLPDITLGAYILDDCDNDTYGLEMSVDFIKGSISNIDDGIGTYRCPDGTSPTVKQQVIPGVLAAASSATSIQVANLLRLFRIPQVSFFSTSSELSNKQRFEYFLRTIPSDQSQAQAMIDIIKRFNWTYISVIYEESIYGIKAFTVLEDLLAQNDICIAVKEKLTKDSGVAATASYDNIAKKLLSKPNAKGVIVFGSDQEVAMLMKAVKRNNATGMFAWIGSDGWAGRSAVSMGNEFEVEGTLSIQPQAKSVSGFDEYFLSLTPKTNKRNPWFIEYWEDFFKCKWPNSTVTPYNQRYDKTCTGNERMSYSNGYEPEKQLQFVSDAVLAFAYAFRNMHHDLCGGTSGLCDRMKPIDGTELLEYLRKVEFRGLSGGEFHFDERADGPARYNIIHFKQMYGGHFEWIQVGEYEDGQLRLDMDKVQFHLEEPIMPFSVCSQKCEKAQEKRIMSGEKCCWTCVNCSKYQALNSDEKCIDCSLGFKPDENKTKCVAIPEEYMQPNSMWSIGAMIFASVGICSTIFVIFVFLKYGDTPIVRASGRELCFVLLGGILMCYGMTFILVQKPSDLLCGVQKAGVGICFSVVYGSLLTKTNRISRIFKAGTKSAKRPNFISPKSQLFICSGIIMIQVFITIVWLAFSPPKAIHVFKPTRDDNHLVCAASIDNGYFIAFLYPICLIVVCTVYAVMTRKIPEAFNESKYIGFTMYTTCIIWLAFVPIYFTSAQSHHIALNLTTMSVAISLSATVTLVCLFTPKLYIIILHPEKNIRQSMMPQAKYGTVKNHNSAPTTSATTAFGTTVSSSIRVESATQSDEYEMNEKLLSSLNENQIRNSNIHASLRKTSIGTQTNGDGVVS